MVKRYDLSFDAEIAPTEFGSFVTFDDYETVQAQLEVAKAGFDAAANQAKWQSSTNKELNALIKENAILKSELDALREQVRWRDVREELPLELDSILPYRTVEVIVTNGTSVGFSEFQAGNGGGTPWRGFSIYSYFNDVEGITHWMPLPTTPTSIGNKD